jgi:hypothetical protein
MPFSVMGVMDYRTVTVYNASSRFWMTRPDSPRAFFQHFEHNRERMEDRLPAHRFPIAREVLRLGAWLGTLHAPGETYRADRLTR